MPIRTLSIALLSTFALLYPLHALASPKVFKHTSASGSYSFQGPIVELSWTSWVDVSPSHIRKTLTTWAAGKDLMSDLETFDVQKHSKNQATLFIERKAPFFMSNPTIQVHATVREDGPRTQIRWTRIGGSVEAFQRSWTLEADGQGTRVHHTMMMKLPIDPPDIVKPNLREEALKDVARFKRFVHAQKILATSPK